MKRENWTGDLRPNLLLCCSVSAECVNRQLLAEMFQRVYRPSGQKLGNVNILVGIIS